MTDTMTDIREARPGTPDHLHDWISCYLGINVARTAVCPGHSAPFDMLAEQFFARPDLALWHGPRGGGKSFLSAVDTHLRSRFHPRYGTKILGGSLAQSKQIHAAIKKAVYRTRADEAAITALLKTEVHYRNESEVSILAASTTSVRGPHVPSLKLDEVDEIDEEVREDAMGISQDEDGSSYPATVLMTSTWHRVAGPMAALMAKADAGEFPKHSFCVFEVLERCPAERSGDWVGGDIAFERCPECPIRIHCHEGKEDAGGIPKAKRSGGHYGIDTLIQKTKGVSDRVFRSDYLCRGPRAAGVWFTDFDPTPGRNVREDAEYDTALPVHISIDSGVFTGAVFFQVGHRSGRRVVNIFADYLAEGLTAEVNARAILAVAGKHCQGRKDRVTTDSAGGARNPIGPTVIAEYERVGLVGSKRREIERWPAGPVADGLATIEALIRSADGSVSLFIHPRCKPLLNAFAAYARAKRGGQIQDYPEDPQHPHEDMIDPVRGGLRIEFPEGRKPEPNIPRVSARHSL